LGLVGLAPTPKPPIPNPQSPIPISKFKKLFNIYNKKYLITSKTKKRNYNYH